MDKQKKLGIEYGVKTAIDMIVKDVDLSKRTVTGFYNTYNYFDADADVLLMGAAKNSIDQHGPLAAATRKIKHAMDHNLVSTSLPGRISVLEEKDIDGVLGIYFETIMSKSTLGTDTLINYQEKVYDNHSIGFRYLDLEFIDPEHKEWVKYIDLLVNPEAAAKAGFLYAVKEIELFEGSTVAVGANQLTPYLGVKSGDPELYKIKLIDKLTLIEKQLKSGKQSDDMQYEFSIQLRQIKQMINEMESSQKPTPPKGPDPVFNFTEELAKAKFL